MLRRLRHVGTPFPKLRRVQFMAESVGTAELQRRLAIVAGTMFEAFAPLRPQGSVGVQCLCG